jgi:hypothetical protein
MIFAVPAVWLCLYYVVVIPAQPASSPIYRSSGARYAGGGCAVLRACPGVCVLLLSRRASRSWRWLAAWRWSFAPLRDAAAVIAVVLARELAPRIAASAVASCDCADDAARQRRR